MSKSNMQHSKFKNYQNTKHLKYRNIALPKTNMNTGVSRPYQHEFYNGAFKNDIYYSMKPSVIAKTYIQNILFYCIPAFLLHGVKIFIDTFSKAILGDEYTTQYDGGMQLLLIIYGVCLFFAFRKISDHMAYYNVEMLVSKFNINQKMATRIYNTFDIENDKELTVMDHYRKKFNKYSLFPSVKELAVENQLYQKAYRSKNENAKQYAELRRNRLNLANKEAEHMAAKEIADWKQQTNGGPNEYDELVKKYSHRTTPAILNIIKTIQNH